MSIRPCFPFTSSINLPHCGHLVRVILSCRKVPEAVQRLWARRMGALYLLNAVLCPLGWLLAAFVSFDTDFILLAQIVGLLLVSLLGVAPLLSTGKSSA